MAKRINPEAVADAVYQEWLKTGEPVRVRRLAELTQHTFASLRKATEDRRFHALMTEEKVMTWVRGQVMDRVENLPNYHGPGSRENFAFLPSLAFLRNKLKNKNTPKMNNAFVAAAKSKLRFDVGRGHLTTEDLFDLSLKDLDHHGRTVRARIRARADESLLDNPDRQESAAKREDDLRFEIIKSIIDLKQTENREKKAAADKDAERRFLNDLLAKKKMDKLESLDLAEIEARIAALDGAAEPEPATAEA